MDASSQPKAGRKTMPIDALLLSLAIFCVFALFAAVVAWVDYTTTRHIKNAAAKSKTDPLKTAA
jgi:hypothetical protein